MKTKNKNFKEILDLVEGTWDTKFLFQTDERKTEDKHEELFESYLYNQTQLIILVLLIKFAM